MRICSALVLSWLLAACSVGEDLPDPEKSFTFDFRDGPQDWVAGFADYPVGEEDFFELTSSYTGLPPEAGGGTALFISGNNHSDDLFMFFKRRVDGLSPGQIYHVRFAVEIASNAPSGCAGIGGAPGESVTLKAGASTVEPVAVNQDGFYVMNLDKGNQAVGGVNALVLTDENGIGNGRACEDPPQYVLLGPDSGSDTVTVTADGAGAIWLFAGTDSGFEGTTSLYYTRFSAFAD